MLRTFFSTVVMLTVFFFSTAQAQSLERLGIADIEIRLPERLINVESERVYKTFPAAAEIIYADLANDLFDKADVIDLLASTEEERLNEVIALGQPIQLQTLDCDYIVHGFLINVNRSNGDNVVTKNDTITVELSVRVLEVKTNQCVFITTARGISSAKQFRVGPLIKFGNAEFYEGQLNEALKEAAHKIASDIVKNF